MKLQIVEIQNQCYFEQEYVLIRATEDCNVGGAILAVSVLAGEDQVSGTIRHAFWLPDQELKKGECIAVWTRPRKASFTWGPGGTFYHVGWGHTAPIWNDPECHAVLFEPAVWHSVPVTKSEN
jgi:hypothetical protein